MALESPLPDRIYETEDEEIVPDAAPSTGMTREELRDALAAERDAGEARMLRVLGGLVPKGVPLQQEETFPEINVDPTGLPDPRHDIEGFLKGYGQRTNLAVQGALKDVVGRVRTETVHTASAVSTNQSLVQRAFELIREAAPEIEDDMIEFSAKKVADSYRAQGIDPMAALSNDFMGVSQEILTYVDTRLGLNETQPLVRRGGANRTGGIRGGGGGRGAPRKVAEEDAGDMVTELRAEQKEKRLY